MMRAFVLAVVAVTALMAPGCGGMVHVAPEQALAEALDPAASATLSVRASGALAGSGLAAGALQQLRSSLYEGLVGRRLIAGIVPEGAGARYGFDVVMISAGESSGGVRAGRDEVALDVEIVDLTDGRVLARFVSRGRSPAPLFASGNAMADAVDQAALGVVRMVSR